MKNLFICAHALLLALAAVLPLQAAAQYEELAKKLITHIPQQETPVRMAVVKFVIPEDVTGLDGAEYVKDELEVELGRDSRIKLITRTDLGALEKEWNFQEGEMADPQTQAQQSKVAGIDVLVRGRVVLQGSGEVCIFAELLNVADGAISKERVSWMPANAQPAAPAHQPASQPALQPAPQPVYQPASQPALQPAPQPVYQPVYQPAPVAPSGIPADPYAEWSAEQLRKEGGRLSDAGQQEQALQLIKRAAAMGDSTAQRWLGWRYIQGRGVGKDKQLAAYWFGRAAAQGDFAAAEALRSNSLQTGNSASSSSYSSADPYAGWSAERIRKEGGRLSDAGQQEQALKLIKRAAAMGDSTAQRWLGFRYLNGRGVAQDKQQARYWFSRAAAQGDSKAAEALKDIR